MDSKNLRLECLKIASEAKAQHFSLTLEAAKAFEDFVEKGDVPASANAAPSAQSSSRTDPIS